MVKVLLLVLIASCLIAAEDISSPSKDNSFPNLGLQLLVQELYNNENSDKNKPDVNEKTESVDKSEAGNKKFEVTKLQVPQPELNPGVDKTDIVPENFDISEKKMRSRFNIKQIMQLPKLFKPESVVPMGILRPTICNQEVYLDPANNKMFSIQSKNYPDPYPPGFMCRWIIKSPNNTRISLTCDTFSVPKCVGCQRAEGFFVSRSGDPELKDAKSFSGQSFPQLESASNGLSVFFLSQRASKIRDGRFNCRVQLADDNAATATVQLAVVGATATLAQCNCGWSNNNRFKIVNGQPTGVNEFPFMCGLVTADDAQIVCGCALISNSYVLTAAHCLGPLSVNTTAVVLGEHDITTGTDTSATILVRAAQFIPYPDYDAENGRYDLALIRLQDPVSYNQNIGPVCLPLASATWDLTGQTVTVMGWGTTEFGGQRSSVLLKTFVDIVDMSSCNETYGSRVSWDTQYCTYRDGTDACQYDSGGPLVWRNPYSARYELVATVVYGRGCAMGYPSINNKVAPFLDWIIHNTPVFDSAKVSFSGQSFPQLESASNGLSVFFLSQRASKIRDGRFNCRVQLADDNAPTATLAQCNCGWSKNHRFRIVNGQPTGVNEFPFMCGLVTADNAQIVCGCALISNSYVLTAAHCLRPLSVSTTAVVLGEHDVNTGTDTSATILVRAAQFIPYPYYDAENERYDLALIRLQNPVSYNQNIGPVCLPFASATWDLRGQTVTVMGWGTTEFGGQRSSVLLKTFVDIIDMSYCNNTYGSRVSWDTQYCTYRNGTDSCQYDSGGPLVWRNPYSARYELVATVEYGWGCAMGYPSINNKVAPFLQWIIHNTPGETFCY